MCFGRGRGGTEIRDGGVVDAVLPETIRGSMHLTACSGQCVGQVHNRHPTAAACYVSVKIWMKRNSKMYLTKRAFVLFYAVLLLTTNLVSEFIVAL